MSDEIVGIIGLAKILDCSPDTVRRMARQHEIPVFKVGNRYKFIPSKVIAYLERNGA